MTIFTCFFTLPEISELSDHGVSLPPNMQGLTDEQIVDLKLKDECGEACKPSGGSVDCKDEVGRRNGCGEKSGYRPEF